MQLTLVCLLAGHEERSSSVSADGTNGLVPTTSRSLSAVDAASSNAAGATARHVRAGGATATDARGIQSHDSVLHAVDTRVGPCLRASHARAAVATVTAGQRPSGRVLRGQPGASRSFYVRRSTAIAAQTRTIERDECRTLADSSLSLLFSSRSSSLNERTFCGLHVRCSTTMFSHFVSSAIF